ncbi:MAG: undecaprenyldiphospho-muramoylpentapeptide beta-N-acetylglucosaminyltransferase [Betaproteobacteria bacterium]|jgi:UDP-N-acetylglucosamine--N-acetylmuramyl-(pentapeptide) pyrophosphoryl-undecaprenol N-acetylglucosamine transferase|nr:undecaprenyldiphospho-muramoylpentapeptide beta-N-acetylglucosaminyltransferase [Pseudomonadota bacterium]NBP34736.1 undecaprenyldiphospho-muramoylpentapeptide beta-N-acetylglucosaminyltransferase [Betaproteobacteria bacterium]NBP37670.1 undecaprenyldiphospho-muramoylpentapeptide beta-N-acetylglucosaminyltransferase [Betaproteobacteria bacterium]NBQ77844.1 undecaprenyldiphospho-muramoylpentapeptide beta-N-acetylglucosaminyltransferase [Betaproteobacteria bacterium]NBQ94536.1 undecaprenyldiph
MNPCLMVMAGGTGGHVIPGLAVAEQLRAQGWRVVWLGNPSGMEARLTERAGIPMRPLVFSGLRGKGLRSLLWMPLRLIRAFVQAIAALRAEKPNVVLGMGGYVAFPGGMMASLLGRPLLIHEQNSVAGLTNRVLAKLADQVFEAFPGSFGPTQANRVMWVGNPVREVILDLPPPDQRYRQRQGPLRLLVLGGSLGAQAINELLPKALALISRANRPSVLHQAGEKHLEALQKAYQQVDVAAQLEAFIGDMAQAYAEADLVIARAGAMTVSEVAAAGVAALFIPFPHAVDDHQTGNAQFLVQAQAAWCFQQDRFSAEQLADLLQALDRQRLLHMAQAARKAAKPEALEVLVRACKEAARPKREAA